MTWLSNHAAWVLGVIVLVASALAYCLSGALKKPVEPVNVNRVWPAEQWRKENPPKGVDL